MKIPFHFARGQLAGGNNAKEFDGRRVFLTGGTGFFGKWLLYAFQSLREEVGTRLSVTVLSRDPGGFLQENPQFGNLPWLEFVRGDIRSFSVSPDMTFDYIIHGATAASAQLERENPAEMFSVIVDGTRQVLTLARKCNARRLLFISSGAVYGPQPAETSHLPESYEGEPENVYGKGKKEAERMCLAAADGSFECVIARPFAFVGPHLPLDAHFAIGNFIRDCLANQPIIIKGDGTPLRSYLYAADLAEWLLTLLCRGRHGCAYNVGSDEAISIAALAHVVHECAGSGGPVVVKGTPSPNLAPLRYIPSIERARSELGLVMCTPLRQAISKTLDWHRNRT